MEEVDVENEETEDKFRVEGEVKDEEKDEKMG